MPDEKEPEEEHDPTRRFKPPQPVITCPNCEEETMRLHRGVWRCSNCGTEQPE